MREPAIARQSRQGVELSSAADRIAHALAVIEIIAGEDERGFVEGKLTPQNRQQFGDDLHIGGNRGGIGLLKSDKETHRRNVVRAILLAQMAYGKLQPKNVDAQRTSLLTRNVAYLEGELRRQFPYKPYRGRFARRVDWEPINFTDPTKHSTSKYMYVVHTIMGEASKVAEVMATGASEGEIAAYNKLWNRYRSYAVENAKNPLKKSLMVRFYEEYLDNPNIVRQNIISSSVISNAKHATYYPFGFIMRVPAECVYITSPTDVGVANRTSDILFELQDKQKKAQSTIYSPQDILARTTGVNNDTGYNEVVVIGTAPEGKQVDVTGIFVKTDAKGNIFMRNGEVSKDTDKPYVNDDIQKMISACAKKHKIPIVPIPDTSSGPSKVAWPFG